MILTHKIPVNIFTTCLLGKLSFFEKWFVIVKLLKVIELNKEENKSNRKSLLFYTKNAKQKKCVGREYAKDISGGQGKQSIQNSLTWSSRGWKNRLDEHNQ